MPLQSISFAVPEITEEDVQAVNAVLRSRWLTTGTVVADFEKALAARLEFNYVVATSSCTAALECALASLRLCEGARVAVPAWTFVSTVTAILRQGLTPVLTDCDPTTLNMSPESFESAIGAGVRAAVIVHFGGNPVDPQLYAIASRAGVPVIEDSAHAMGMKRDDTVGSVASCYSFYATKNLTTGEGGAVATDDPETADFARRYSLHGLDSGAWKRYAPGGLPTYDVLDIGIKGNMPDVLAALGLSQLRRFHDMQARRRTLILTYREHLDGVPGVELIPREYDTRTADHLCVVLLPEGTDRKTVVDRLAARGVHCSVHFTPVHLFTGLRGSVLTAGPLDNCERLAPRALSLPLHPLMSESDAKYVVASLSEVLDSSPAGPMRASVGRVRECAH